MVCGAHQVGYTTHRITFLMARIHLAPLQVELHYPESTGTLELINVISHVIHFISVFKSPASLPSAHILTHTRGHVTSLTLLSFTWDIMLYLSHWSSRSKSPYKWLNTYRYVSRKRLSNNNNLITTHTWPFFSFPWPWYMMYPVDLRAGIYFLLRDNFRFLHTHTITQTSLLHKPLDPTSK